MPVVNGGRYFKTRECDESDTHSAVVVAGGSGLHATGGVAVAVGVAVAAVEVGVGVAVRVGVAVAVSGAPLPSPFIFTLTDFLLALLPIVSFADFLPSDDGVKTTDTSQLLSAAKVPTHVVDGTNSGFEELTELISIDAEFGL